MTPFLGDPSGLDGYKHQGQCSPTLAMGFFLHLVTCVATFGHRGNHFLHHVDWISS